MATDKLRSGMNYNVRTMFDRTNEERRAESVVYDERYVVAMCYFSYGLEVGHVRVGVAKRFSIYHLRIGLDGCFKSFKVVDIDDGVRHALSGKCVSDEVERTTIEVVGCYDMVAIAYDILQSVSHSCCTAGYSQACYATFESGYAVFKHALRRVGQTTIYITCIA